MFFVLHILTVKMWIWHLIPIPMYIICNNLKYYDNFSLHKLFQKIICFFYLFIFPGIRNTYYV